MRVLFINACVRQESRTLALARYAVDKLDGQVTELVLEKENIFPINEERLHQRDRLSAEKESDSPVLRYARQFAEADMIVIAAPFWDLSFPAYLKTYLENITVANITFRYEQGVPTGLCNAKSLLYITTAGGPIFSDFGYSYVKELSEKFYGIKNVFCVKAEGLDIIGANVDKLITSAKDEITTTINEIEKIQRL